MKKIKVKGFQHYFVDKNGKVFNTKISNKPKELKSYPNKNTGYHQVVLRNGVDKPKCVYVHRLVAEAYIDNKLNLPEVNHIDYNKSNNSVSNLEWVTRKQNISHRNIIPREKQVIDNIIKDKVLLQNGITLYKKIGRLESLSKYWNTSNTTSKKILKKYKIEIYKRNLIPVYIKEDLINAYNKNMNWKRRHIIQYAYDTYKLNISNHYVYSIINNKKSFFSKVEKK